MRLKRIEADSNLSITSIKTNKVDGSGNGNTLSDINENNDWLHRFHSWLAMKTHSSYEMLRTTGHFVDQTGVIGNTDQLLEEVSMVETSILLQAEQLEKATNLFIQVCIWLYIDICVLNK